MKDFEIILTVHEEEDYEDWQIKENVLSRVKRQDSCGIWNIIDVEINEL